MIFRSLLLSGTEISRKRAFIIILLIKLPLFIFYAIHYHLYPEVSVSHGFLYADVGDTFTYYPPLIKLLSGGEYGNACRMPGLLPVFGPFYLLTGNEDLSFNAVIITQFIVSTISVYILGLMSRIIFNSEFVFLLTIISYSLFYHIGDHFLMADSLANSTLIIASYLFLRGYNNNFKSNRDVFLSGMFFTWSLFLRMIAIVPYMILGLLLFWFAFYHSKKLFKAVTAVFLFFIVFFVCESAWIIRNKISLNRFIPFTVFECYSTFSYDWLKLMEIPAAWGLETTRWGDEIDWWQDPDLTPDSFPYASRTTTSGFNADSLYKLKSQYYELKRSGMGINEVSVAIESRVDIYLDQYRKEHALQYYIVNPLKLLFKFHYKRMISDMPFPKLSEMNLMQKAIKVANWMFISTSGLLFLLVAPVSLFQRRKTTYVIFLIIPFSISFFLCFIIKAVEQRYFWPILPFAFVFMAYCIQRISSKFQKKPTQKRINFD